MTLSAEGVNHYIAAGVNGRSFLREGVLFAMIAAGLGSFSAWFRAKAEVARRISRIWCFRPFKNLPN